MLSWRLDDKSRMTGDCHVRICGSVGVKFPRATRIINIWAFQSYLVVGGLKSRRMSFFHEPHSLSSNTIQRYNHPPKFIDFGLKAARA